MSDYISYKKIPSVLKIEKGDVILLTSDITDLFLQCQENGEIMDAKTLTPRSSTHDKKKILDKIAIKLGCKVDSGRNLIKKREQCSVWVTIRRK